MHEAVGEWCERWLGSAVSDVLFETGFLSVVTGVRLADGREVVVKLRRCEPRLNAAYRVQQHVWRRGYPAPEPLVAPVSIDPATCASAERFVSGGEPGGRGRDAARRSAEALAWLHRIAPAITDVGDLSPDPPWVEWDHGGPGLWPAPVGGAEDLNSVDGPSWLDDAGLRARQRLGRYHAPRVVGHGDWHSDNVLWSQNKLLVVHDWDGVVYQPEAVVAGIAAAIFPASDSGSKAATVAESEMFLDAYLRAKSGTWTQDDIQAFWAASVWTRAVDAKEESANGAVRSLGQTEAHDRLALAGA